jgi:S-adenosylmethionine uptake transporter
MARLSAPTLMLTAAFLFATMGVCVKLASALYSTGEIVFYRGLVGSLFMGWWAYRRGGSLRTRVPGMHFWRSGVGVTALMLWFYSIGQLPLGTAVTLNYMSSVWMALFLIGGAVVVGSQGNAGPPQVSLSPAGGGPGAARTWGRSPRIDGRLIATVLTGFAGVALVLRPTLDQHQLWAGLIGLLSGMLAALAYLQVAALGRMGEPDWRTVFYFSVGCIVAGAGLASFSGLHGHTLRGAALLLAMSLLATTAQMMITRAYAIGKALSNASLQYMGIAFSTGYGVLLFGDRLSATALAGMLLIVGAGLAATLLRSRTAPAAFVATTPPNEL